ncbi:MAG TPA: GGDEF domain-containing protein, partial [Methyloceanibacter sp.]|nr:GGDEF domain-containing protein [Methyloceanibacter sp.]
AGDAGWKLVVTPAQAGLIHYRAWLVFAGVLLALGGLLAYMWASLRHALRLEHANSRILELAQTDLLTNLPNRRAFLKRLTMAFTASWRGAPPFAVLYLDIDNFKDVNDTLGHAMGDLLLKEVVSRFKSGVRSVDFVARFGGDEFAVLLPDVTDPRDGRRLGGTDRQIARRTFQYPRAQATHHVEHRHRALLFRRLSVPRR